MRTVPLLSILLLLSAPLPAQIRLPKPKLPLPSTPGASSAPARTPTFDDRVVEMTDARLSGLLRGLAAEQAQVAKLEELEQQQRDQAAEAAVEERRQGTQREEELTAAEQKVKGCVERSAEYQAATAPAKVAQQEAAMERARKFAEARNYVAMQAISDSLTRETERQNAIMLEVARRCGATDEMLRKWGDGEAADTVMSVDAEIAVVDVRDSLAVLGAGASGMTRDQYTVMRERVLAYLNTSPDDLRRSSYVFSATELRALQGKRAQLGRYQELLASY